VRKQAFKNEKKRDSITCHFLEQLFKSNGEKLEAMILIFFYTFKPHRTIKKHLSTFERKNHNKVK